MYFPFLRLKQYEAIALREVADIVATASQVPIVEPVKASAQAMNRMTSVVQDISNHGGQIILIVNPMVGEFSRNNGALITAINTIFPTALNMIIGVLIDVNTTPAFLQGILNTYGANRVAIIHKEMSQIPNLPTLCAGVAYNIYFAGRVSPAYEASLAGSPKVLVHNGFIQRNNADYPPDEFFSSLHLTFNTSGYDGFGDFLTVGDQYRERGGPAYAVALHLTYFRQPPTNPDMHIKHFISTSNTTTANPGGKFAEALANLMAHLNSPNSVIENTRGVVGYRALHNPPHYPGLGVPKKLSMMHHMEIMANRFP